jgi:hypothetical protein
VTQPRTVSEVRRRLGEPGATQRSVAAATGLSKATVARIATGECDGVDGRLPQDPSPAEIRERARMIRAAGGGKLVNPDIAEKLGLLREDTEANRSYRDESGVEVLFVHRGEIFADFAFH